MIAIINERNFKNAKLIYGAALFCLALTVIVSSCVMQLTIQGHHSDSRVVNLAGRQRMLSQRLTKCVLLLERMPAGPAQTERLKEFSESLAMWKAVQRGLQQGDARLGLPARENSEEIADLFAKIDPFFTAMVQSLDEVKRRDGRINPAGLRSAAGVMLRNETPFLNLMDQITFRFDREARESAGLMQIVVWGIAAVLWLLLWLEFLWVFGPAGDQAAEIVKAHQQQLNELQEANADLQTGQEELLAINQKLAEKEQNFNAISQQLQKEVEEANAKWTAGQQQLDALNQKFTEHGQDLKAVNRQLAASQEQLKAADRQLEKSKEELQEKLNELEKMNMFMVERENRIIELKKEVNRLSQGSGNPEPYRAGAS